MFHFGPSWSMKHEFIFEMNLMPILFYHISQVVAHKNVTTLSQKCEEKQ